MPGNQLYMPDLAIDLREHFRARRRRRADILSPAAQAVLFHRLSHVRGFGALKRAGESALAELTDLSPPPLDTFAVAASDWKKTADHDGLFETDRDNADGIVETWAYDPAGLSGTHVVDRLSLYAQFRDHRDERVSLAAERLLEDMAW